MKSLGNWYGAGGTPGAKGKKLLCGLTSGSNAEARAEIWDLGMSVEAAPTTETPKNFLRSIATPETVKFNLN
jgi:hypothetical protein